MVSLRPRKPKQEAAPAIKKASSAKPVKSKKPAPSKKAPAAAKGNPKKSTSPKAAKNEDAILQEFLTKNVPDQSKHNDITSLYNMIRKGAPDLEPELQGKATLAFGGFDYQTKSKCSGRWSRIGIMVNKTGLSLMVSGMKEGTYLLEQYDKKRIGKKISLGKSCIRFSNLSDINLDVMEEIIAAAAVADVSYIAV